MTVQIGHVISVKGVKVVLKIFDESSKDTLFYNGKKFKGVSIREHLIIRRGFKDIICLVEGEYLDESKFETDGDNNKKNYIRKVEVKPIGRFEGGIFYEGIKYLPMIKDPAYLVPEDKISKIYSREQGDEFVIGEMLKEELPVTLPWQRLFNSHIGIFGNTGSGKSNTLATLYTTLLSQKKEQIRGKSKFIFIDFNGEYTRGQIIGDEDKNVINLNTRKETRNKFSLASQEFWNKETLCILFKATAHTQSPFINRLIVGRERYKGNSDSLGTYLRSTIKRAFVSTSQKRESIELLKAIVEVIDSSNPKDSSNLKNKLEQLVWRGEQSKFYLPPPDNIYFDGEDDYKKVFEKDVSALSLTEIDAFDELIIRVNLQLINDLIYGYVQFEHIQPLLKRIEASLTNLKRVIKINEETQNEKILTVISFRKCNEEIKKIVPLLLAKHYFHQQKDIVGNPPDKTMHLVIDEAHNILSEQSMREHESWKDYRLEMFEEIIKEGRKFGFFLTISSQRPADISPTIMSQVHNFFIHRLVNDKDLFLLDNTISTLDSLSKSMIPNLAKGCCIVTGTSFDIPIVMQIKILDKDRQPDSEDIDLVKLWEK